MCWCIKMIAVFFELDRHAQINCVVDVMTKRQICDADCTFQPWQRRFPLEPICGYLGHKKLRLREFLHLVLFGNP